MRSKGGPSLHQACVYVHLDLRRLICSCLVQKCRKKYCELQQTAQLCILRSLVALQAMLVLRNFTTSIRWSSIASGFARPAEECAHVQPALVRRKGHQESLVSSIKIAQFLTLFLNFQRKSKALRMRMRTVLRATK